MERSLSQGLGMLAAAIGMFVSFAFSYALWRRIKTGKKTGRSDKKGATEQRRSGRREKPTRRNLRHRTHGFKKIGGRRIPTSYRAGRFWLLLK